MYNHFSSHSRISCFSLRLELTRYVVLNPVRANMVKNIIDWKWSSYQAMIGEALVQCWLEIDWILGQFSS